MCNLTDLLDILFLFYLRIDPTLNRLATKPPLDRPSGDAPIDGMSLRVAAESPEKFLTQTERGEAKPQGKYQTNTKWK